MVRSEIFGLLEMLLNWRGVAQCKMDGRRWLEDFDLCALLSLFPFHSCSGVNGT